MHDSTKFHSTDTIQSDKTGAEAVAQEVEHLPSMHDALATHELGTVLHTCNPSTWEVEAGGSASYCPALKQALRVAILVRVTPG